MVLIDNIQECWCVQSCLYIVVEFIHKQHAEVVAISVQSDNATNYNTRAHIEFIYQMNLNNWLIEDGSTFLKIDRWIFTEL